jgi:hypothetical protein
MNLFETGPILIVISRDEVRRQDISGPLMTLKHLIADRDSIRDNMLNVDVSFAGYESTREELFEIPEVRSYVHALDAQFPFWLYFLSRQFTGLQCLAYCYLPPFLTPEARAKSHPQLLVDLIERRWAPALFQICSVAGHTAAEADDLLESAMEYFASGPSQFGERTVDDDSFEEDDQDGDSDDGLEGQESEEDDHADGDTDAEDLFGLLIEDARPFADLSAALRVLLQRPDIPPVQIHELAKLILIIEALPRPTPGIQVDLDLVKRHENGESSSMGIRAGSDEIKLDCSEYIIVDPRIGGDSQCEVWFECSAGGCREEISPFALREWVEQFVDRAADPSQEILIFADSSDDSEIDWSPESSGSLWRKLDTNFP